MIRRQGAWRSRAATLMAAGLLAAHADAVRPQEYPSRAIRLVLPFPAGGGSDVIARVTAQKLTAALGQSVVVDNRAGASGNIATEIVARAPADGYTLLFGNSSLAIAPAVFSKLPFDPARDFAAISMVSSYPFVFAAHPSLPVKSVRELIALAKARPQALDYASAGAGTMSHFAMELLALKSGIRATHLPYKGAAPAGIALLSGEAQLAFLVIPVAAPQINAGRLRGLGVAAKYRAAVLPGVPTMTEAGVAGHEALQWNGFLAPARTPPPVLDRLYRELVKILAAADVKQRFADEGADAVGSSPAEFAAFVRVETDKWSDVAKRSGTRLD